MRNVTLLAGVTGLLLLAACSPAPAGPPASTPTPHSAVSPDAELPPAIGPPPPASASAAGQTVALELDRDCWADPHEGDSCADSLGLVTNRVPLRVRQGESFTVAGEFARDGLHGAAAQAILREAGDGTVTDMPVQRAGAYTWRFVADLPPGSYVVAFFETAGDVTYGLLLDVR